MFSSFIWLHYLVVFFKNIFTLTFFFGGGGENIFSYGLAVVVALLCCITCK